MSTNVNRSQDIAELDPMTFEQLDQATQIENNDIFVIDQPDATRKVLYTDVKTKILSEDGSNLTVNYDVVDTVENIAPGETIGTMFKKISSWFISKISQLGTLAFKDKVSESDLDSAYISTITGHLNDTVLHSTSTEKELWNDKYTKAEIDEKLGLIEQPEIPVASTEVNGLMSKESVVELSRLGDSVSQLNSAIDNMNDRIFAGTMSFIQGINPNGSNSRNVSLPKAFKDNNYQVILTINTVNGNIDYWSWVSLRAFAKTEEMFTVWATNNHSSGAIPAGLTIDWIAIHA